MPKPDRLHQLEDALERAEKRVAEMRAERDEAYEQVIKMSEHVRDSRAVIDQWKEAFDMQQRDDGMWTFADGSGEKYMELLRIHNDLVGRWNTLVKHYSPQDIGRPLAASEAQCETVLKLRKRELSLRIIAEETSLGLRTVRTIIERDEQRDRTTIKRYQKLDPMRAAAITEKARARTRKALPDRISVLEADADALVKEAKGLGKK